MSLPARQERVLQSIDEGLCSSEPKLAAKFAMFARLCGSERLPRREQLLSRAAARPWRRTLSTAPVSGGGNGVLRVVIFGHLAIVLVLLAVFVAVTLHPAGRCARAATGRGLAAVARVRTCSLQVGTQNSLLPK